jgi:DNA-binding protein HU-beta
MGSRYQTRRRYNPIWTGIDLACQRITRSYGSIGNRPLGKSIIHSTEPADHRKISKADAKRLVDIIFSAIADAAASGTEVSIAGFGKFKVKDSPAREGRNQSNGETLQIAASRKLRFSAAKAVNDKLNV